MPSEDEIFILQLLLIPALFLIISMVICEHVLFGREKWPTFSDTKKSLALLIPISMLLYSIFWVYLLINSYTFVQAMFVAMNFFGFACSFFLMRNYFHGKQSSLQDNLMFNVFLYGLFSSLMSSSVWLSNILYASLGAPTYISYVSRTHILETGWTFIFWFGLLTPTLYIVGIVLRDPSFLFPKSSKSKIELDEIRSYVSLGLSVWALVPFIGFSAYAFLGLITSAFNLFWFKIKNMKIYIALVISLIVMVLLVSSFFSE